MNWIIATIGFLLLFYAILFFIRDCKGNVSSTMGGNMSFGVYWTIGMVLLSLCILPVIQLSRWWSIPGCLLSMVISIPVRSVITKIFCVPYKPEPTGFQKFIKKPKNKNYKMAGRDMNDYDFPYNLPIWRDTFQLDSPDGKWAAKIFRASEVSMGNPTIGILELSNGFKLDRCNPSFIWSDDSRYLAVPRYFKRFGIFTRQRLAIIDVVNGCVYESNKIACYFQPESFLQGQLVVTEEPFSDAVRLEWRIPENLNQFNAIKGVLWP